LNRVERFAHVIGGDHKLGLRVGREALRKILANIGQGMNALPGVAIMEVGTLGVI